MLTDDTLGAIPSIRTLVLLINTMVCIVCTFDAVTMSITKASYKPLFPVILLICLHKTQIDSAVKLLYTSGLKWLSSK